MQKKKYSTFRFLPRFPTPVVACCNNSWDPLTASLAPHSFPNQMNQIKEAKVGHLPGFLSFYDVHVCIVYCVLCQTLTALCELIQSYIRPGINYSQPHLSFFLISIPMFSAQDTPHLKISLLCNSVFWSEIFWLVLFSSLPQKQS